MWRNLVNTGIVCLLLGGTVSCGRTDVYNEFNTLPKNGWFKRDVQRFTPEVPDTVNRYDVYLSLRHNGDYTYRNLWLFVSYNDEDGVLKTDTLSGVIYQNGAFTAVVDGQFNEPVAASAYNAARDALNGWDPTNGCVYYYNPAKTSNAYMHAKPTVTVIGSHRFCM